MPMILIKWRVEVNMSGSECIELRFFDVLYQTQKTVFDHISKHREDSLKYDAQRSIFDELRGVWKCGQTLS